MTDRRLSIYCRVCLTRKTANAAGKCVRCLDIIHGPALHRQPRRRVGKKLRVG